MTGLTHCLLIRWGAHADRQAVERRTATLLDELAHDLPRLTSCRHGPSLGLAGSADYGAVLEFDSFDDYDDYVAHHAHESLRAHLREHAQHRMHVQFTAERDAGDRPAPPLEEHR